MFSQNQTNVYTFEALAGLITVSLGRERARSTSNYTVRMFANKHDPLLNHPDQWLVKSSDYPLY